MKTHEPNSNHEPSDSFTTLLRESIAGEPLPPADPTLREALLKRLDQPQVTPALSAAAANRRRTFFQRAGIALVSTAALALAAVVWQRPNLAELSWHEPPVATQAAQEKRSERSNSFGNQQAQVASRPARGLGMGRGAGDRPEEEVDGRLSNYDSTVKGTTAQLPTVTSVVPAPAPVEQAPATTPGLPYSLEGVPVPADLSRAAAGSGEGGAQPTHRPTPSPDDAQPMNERIAAGPQFKTDREASIRSKQIAPVDSAPERPAINKTVDELQAVRERMDKSLKRAQMDDKFNHVVELTDGVNQQKNPATARPGAHQPQLLAKLTEEQKQLGDTDRYYRFAPQVAGEQYAKIVENQFLNPRIAEQALSTFSIDVDTASYANVRRFLTNGQLPPPDAVRLEELVNYFKYKYPQPKGDDPFSVNMEMADCPWQPGHKLLRVGLQGKEIHRAERPASNIVFLIDTSGSMTDQNKLPLLKQAFTLLVAELGENDKVTIVTYAGNAGLRLEPTRGDQKEKIIAAIEGLQSGGSTHGSAGIQLAYEQAAAQFIKGGTNKVILATDGDLNVGITDDAALVELITKKAETGVFLTVLGVGTGNLKDAKMERLADNGNGLYAYLDSVREARKVLVEEMSGSLVTIAKDVKIQIEFNPAHIQSYRLLGYENRILAHQDFDNDAKDAGEIGAGHSVTALYEVALVGAPEVKSPAGEPLRYQRIPAAEPKRELTEAAQSGELLTLKLRYKQPDGKESKKLEFPLTDKGGSFNSASQDFQFASAVVAFGLSLRQSDYRGSANLSAVAEIATAATGEDIGGHRAEFLDLVRRAKALRGE